MAKTRKEPTFDPDVLIDSWNIRSSYNGVPTMLTDQVALIKNRYGDMVRGRQVAEMLPQQVFNVATSIYERALRITQNLTPEDKQVMPALVAYRDALAQRNGNLPITEYALSMDALTTLDARIERLEERIPIQFEGCNVRDDSLVITAYDTLQLKYKRKERQVA